jgi:hypothetical protein
MKVELPWMRIFVEGEQAKIAESQGGTPQLVGLRGNKLYLGGAFSVFFRMTSPKWETSGSPQRIIDKKIIEIKKNFLDFIKPPRINIDTMYQNLKKIQGGLLGNHKNSLIDYISHVRPQVSRRTK